MFVRPRFSIPVLRWTLVLACWFVLAADALSADVSVKARLSHRAVQTGSAAILEIEVLGAEENVEPPNVEVDGLDIQYMGPSQSRQVQIINGQMHSEVKVSYRYRIVPQREGDYSIPAVSVSVDGRSYQTQPVGLKVDKSTSRNQPGNASDNIGFAEIDIPKKKAYVGELVPVELRLFIRSGIRAEMERGPNLTGEGFTIQKMPEPDQQQEQRDGVDYSVVIFRAIMTPSKAGNLTIGPFDLPFVAQVPRTRRARGNSLADSFFGDDFFDPFGSFAERRRFEAKAPAVNIEVMPLPAEGRPSGFSGAVGQFEMEAEGSPSRIKAGDPVTMRLMIKGSGNFDRVAAPTLVDPEGWQAYDSSEKFEPGDDLKSTGIKTFEMPVVAQGPQDHMPQFAFSYFDPKVAKYVTKRNRPAPLVVEGSPAPAPAPVGTASSSSPAPAEPAPEAESGTAAKLAGIRYETGSVGTFTPLYAQRSFLLWQAIPAAAVFGLLAMRLLRRDAAKERQSSLQRERGELWRRLRSREQGAVFYDHAVRLLQIETALATGVEPGSVDSAVIARTQSLNADLLARIEEIFDARGALLFAGGGTSSSEVSPEQRSRVMETLEQFAGK